MHGSEIREEALRLVAADVNDCDIGRMLGIPRSTVRDWRRPRYFADMVTCPQCGHISRLARTQSLRISLDARCSFANHSADILELIESICRAQGLSPRRYARAIRLNRRVDDARLLEHVGLKF